MAMVRPTFHVFPIGDSERAALCLPWALCVSPLAPPRAQSEVCSVLETEDPPHLFWEDIPRCTNCRSYLSAPSETRGCRWRCFLCGTQNDNYPPSGVQPDLRRPDYSADVALDLGNLQPLYVFVLEEVSDESLARLVSRIVCDALSVIGSNASCALVTFSGTRISVLDVSMWSFRVVHSVSGRAGGMGTVRPARKWVTKIEDDEKRTNISEAVYKVCQMSLPEENVGGRSTSYVSCAAVRIALDICEDFGALASRVFVIARSARPGPESDMRSLTLEVDSRPSRTASERLDESLSSAETLQFFSSESDCEYCGEGMRAILAGAVVDVFSLENRSVGMDREMVVLAAIAQHSGGSFSFRSGLDESLLTSFLSRLRCPVGVRGTLRLRTSPELEVQEVYGATVQRDLDVPDVFCVVAGHKSATFVVDVGFSNIEGLSATYRRPGFQLAFRCILLDPRRTLRSVVYVRSVVFSVSRVRLSIESSLDVAATTAALFHKAAASCVELGVEQARVFLLEWIIDLVANIYGLGASSRDKSGAQIADSTSVTRFCSPQTALDTMPLVVFGLLQTALLSLESSPENVTESKFFLEALDPDTLLRHVTGLANQKDDQRRAAFCEFLKAVGTDAMH